MFELNPSVLAVQVESPDSRQKDEPGYNPEMIALAREAAGLTQSGLAATLGISQSRVSKVEEGAVTLPSEQLELWAARLGQPVQILSYRGPVRPPSLSFYRKTSTVPMKAFEQFNGRMNLRRIEILTKLSGRSVPKKFEIPHFPVSSESEAAGAAKRLRKLWRIPRGPIECMAALVQSAGCVVELFDFGTEKIDGLAIGGGTNLPIVFLNRTFPSDRRRLSLAHELAHLVLHREIRDTVEEEAWAFAAEFLMPEAEISGQLYPLSVEKLAELKLVWKVSMQAILKRAKTLGRVSDRYAQFLWMRLGQYGYRKSEPYESQMPPEIPKTIEDLMDE